MGLLDKVKSQAEQAATKAKEGVHDVQVKRELGQVYDELGKLAFELVDAGEIAHDRLTPLVVKVRDLQAQIEEHAPVEQVEEEPPVAEGPPAMPN
jgi:hypothetical protein